MFESVKLCDYKAASGVIHLKYLCFCIIERFVFIWTDSFPFPHFEGKVRCMSLVNVYVKLAKSWFILAWCCSDRCADLKNAWLKLMIPLLYPALPALSRPPPPPFTIYGMVVLSNSISLNFNNISHVVKLLFCTIFHKTHYVPCL